MLIFIPTFDREAHQPTLDYIPPEWHIQTYFVSSGMVGTHNFVRCDETEIKRVKQWIIEHALDDIILILNNRLRFYRCKDGDLNNLVQASKSDMLDFFNIIQHWLEDEGIPLVGVRTVTRDCRFLHRSLPDYPYMENTLPKANIGFDRRYLFVNKIRFDEAQEDEDYYVGSELMQKGYATRINTEFVAYEV